MTFFTMRRLSLIILLAVFFAVPSSFAQLTKSVIGINGLTCSQCAKSVYNRLNKIKFIQKIDIDLNATEATVYFKQGMLVNYDELAEAVTKAGYSVRNMYFELKVATNDMIQDQQWCGLKHCVAFDKPINVQQGQHIYFQLIGRKYEAGGAKESFSRISQIGKLTYPAKIIRID